MGGEGDNRGWDGWMASPTQWTWVWVNSWSWWWTGKPGVLQSVGSQRVGHEWATELNWTMLYITSPGVLYFITGSLYLLTTFTHLALTSTHPASSNHQFVFCLCGFFFFFQIPYIREFIQYLSLSLWFISLNVMPWRFIHSVPNSRISFFCIDEKYYILHIISSSFIYSSMDTWVVFMSWLL